MSIIRRLLIADDQPGIRLLLSEVFSREGYEIDLAANGIEALQRVKDKQPNCILLDMEMPIMNGGEFLAQFKKDWPDIPVVLMTAHSGDELTDEVLDAITHLFIKPFDIYEVRAFVNGLFETDSTVSGQRC